ncbi:hypothetical protein PAXRUDRAFT_152170, partial [Paxillus rubicundulus Ve08.2h10]
LTYINQQHLDTSDLAALYATKHKTKFNRKVLNSTSGEVTFNKAQLVQVYNNTLDTTLLTTHKLLPRWSMPRQILNRVRNSYQLTTLDDFPIPGLTHTRRLHHFIP